MVKFLCKKQTPNMNQYEEFNKFQSDFYTSRSRFGDNTRFDVNRHGYTLLNNLAKGFPNLADIILNLKGLNWSGPTSLAVLKALQTKFVNEFAPTRIPQFIYFKNNKSASKPKQEKQEEAEIIRTVCNAYIIDTKTYEALKETSIIKKFVSQIKGELNQTKKLKKKSK